MDITFKNIYLEALAKDEVKGKQRYAEDVIIKFRKTLRVLEAMPTSQSLWKLNSLCFEALKGKRKGYFSVRVDYHYRLIFEITHDIISIREILIITELTNHYQ